MLGVSGAFGRHARVHHVSFHRELRVMSVDLYLLPARTDNRQLYRQALWPKITFLAFLLHHFVPPRTAPAFALSSTSSAARHHPSTTAEAHVPAGFR